MLHRILQEIEAVQGTINLSELAQRLDIEQSALEGMIAFWVRKGRLKLHEPTADKCGEVSCGGGCPDPEEVGGCPFVIKLPRTYSLTLHHKD